MAACDGLPGAPGHIELTIVVGTDGNVEEMHSEGDIGGTMVSACVEDAVSSAAEFAAAVAQTRVTLTYDVGAQP